MRQSKQIQAGGYRADRGPLAVLLSAAEASRSVQVSMGLSSCVALSIDEVTSTPLSRSFLAEAVGRY